MSRPSLPAVVSPPCSSSQFRSTDVVPFCCRPSRYQQPRVVKQQLLYVRRKHQLQTQCSLAGDEKNGFGGDSYKNGFNKPENAREAISYGLQLFGNERYEEALELFNVALDLPGSGQSSKSDPRGIPPEISTAEMIAALYNVACCYAALKHTREGILAVGACMELGYKDFKQLLTDHDLVELQEDPRFELMVDEYKARASQELDNEEVEVEQV